MWGVWCGVCLVWSRCLSLDDLPCSGSCVGSVGLLGGCVEPVVVVVVEVAVELEAASRVEVVAEVEVGGICCCGFVVGL